MSICTKDGWIFYSDKKTYKVHIDDLARPQEIWSNALSCLSIYGDQICGIESNKKLVIMNFDGTNSRLVYKVVLDSILKSILYNDKIYFIKHTPPLVNMHINMIGLSNNKPVQLDNSINQSLSIINNQVYFSKGMNAHLYKMNLDGTDKQKVFSKGLEYCISSDFIYYNDKKGDDCSIAKCSLVDNNKTRLLFNYCGKNFSVFDGWLYFIRVVSFDINIDNKFRVHRVRIDGSQYECINDLDTDSFIIIGKDLYFISKDANKHKKVHKIKL